MPILQQMLVSKAKRFHRNSSKNVGKCRESSLWKCHVRKLHPVEIAIIYPDGQRETNLTPARHRKRGRR